MSIQIATKTIAEMLSRAGTFDLSSGTDVNSPNATTVYELGTYMNKYIYMWMGEDIIYFIIIFYRSIYLFPCLFVLIANNVLKNSLRFTGKIGVLGGMAISFTSFLVFVLSIYTI